MRKHIGAAQTGVSLLDIVAVTGGAAANPTLATVVTPAAGPSLDANGLLHRGSRSVKGRVVAMNADEVATQIVFTAE